MSVTGSAQLKVSPDCADISFSISVENAKPSVAAQMLQAKSNALVEQFKLREIDEGDIKLSTLELSPQLEYSQPLQKQVFKGYTARSNFTASLKDFSKIGELYEVGANAGATSISLAYRRSDLPELRKKVRDMALEAARAKAEQMAKGLGIKLGRIVSVSEMGSPWMQPANNQVVLNNFSANQIGGEFQTLSLDITVGYKLSSDS